LGAGSDSQNAWHLTPSQNRITESVTTQLDDRLARIEERLADLEKRTT